MSLAFKRVGKCGEAERALLMGEIENLRSSLISIKADRIRDKAEIQRLKNENWRLKRHDRERGRSDSKEEVGFASYGGPPGGARAAVEDSERP